MRFTDTIKINRFVQVGLVQDNDAEAPDDDMVKIAYAKRSRYVLGTEGVDDDRVMEIAKGIADGTLIGCMVYAYVHGGVTIRCAPFGDPWDSGCSGMAYADAALIKSETPDPIKYINGVVETFNSYLTGDVWGYVVQTRESEADEWEDGEDSCWGFFGFDYAKEEAQSAGKYAAKCEAQRKAKATRRAKWEAKETAEWAAHDVVTTC